MTPSCDTVLTFRPEWTRRCGESCSYFVVDVASGGMWTTLVTSDHDTGAAEVGVQEVEVKYRVTDSAALLPALAAASIVLSPPVHQDDQAYAPCGWEYGRSKVGVPFARLRTQDGRHLFTVKRPLDNEMACLEYETEVASRDQMHQALAVMGFRPTVRIVKRRRSAVTASGMAICVDEVELLGTFLEVERRIGPHESGVAVQQELDRFVASLGVQAARISDTYDSLIQTVQAPISE